MSSKVKVLLFGSAQDLAASQLVVSKLKSLHTSKAGPFHVAFAVGGGSVLIDTLKKEELPCPVYIQDTMGGSLECPAVIVNDIDANNESTVSKGENEDEEDTSPCLKLGNNLYLLRDKNHVMGTTDDAIAGIWDIPIPATKSLSLVVASCPPRFRVESGSSIMDKLTHCSYTGCDFLLTTEWPQGIEHVMNDNTSENISFDIADVALKARARYHVAPHSGFQQTPAFQHLVATTSTTTTIPTGRFLTLGPMTATKDKTKKCVHAVGVVPFHYMGSLEQEKQQKALPCPFTDAAYQPTRTNVISNTENAGNAGLSEAAARRILAEEQTKHGGQGDRWGVVVPQNRKRKQEDQEQDVDPTNMSLFIHGLHKDVTGRLQMASPESDQHILKAFEGAIRIRRPVRGSTSAFCFVDFQTHQQAARCLDTTAGHTTIDGVELQVKWATTHNKHTSNEINNSGKKRQRLTEKEAHDSSTIYFKITNKTPESTLTTDLPRVGEALRKWMERTLEDALAGEDVDASADRVTAETEPALQVQLRLPELDGAGDSLDDVEEDKVARKKKNYGFLDFASHAAASMAVATRTGSTDGGKILESVHPPSTKDNPIDKEKLTEKGSKFENEDENKGSPLDQVVIYLNWAQKRIERNSKGQNDSIEDEVTGFKFHRKHFPADSRKDCWFCLASEACEKHLITGVHDMCYTVMPKGPVHPGHVLLVPVHHTDQGAWKDSKVAEEMETLKSDLRQHAAKEYGAELYVFERAIATKGGYHTHVQCIPVEKGIGRKLLTTMMSQGNKAAMDLREVNSDVGMDAILNNSDDNDDDESETAGYFYAEIPVADMEYKRILHKSRRNDKAQVPLQFGREVLAAVLGNPDLAHWKSCLVDKEQEASIASELRDSFENFRKQERI